jgi:amino acid adenylation domain-containing protein
MDPMPEHPPSTLVELLRRRARQSPAERAYTFLLDGESAEAHLSYGELDRQARAIAARLQAAQAASPGNPKAPGDPGAERALLLYPPGLQYVAAFFGCLYAGVTAVPAYPPRPNRTDERLLSILADARPRWVLTTSAALPSIERLLGAAAGAAGGLPGCRATGCLATDGLAPELADDWRDPEPRPESLAFLQYTSGSTSAPKGVMVSHRNLLHNERLIRDAFAVTPSSVVVGWLPLYHDMGLIGNLLQPLYTGCRCVLMSPVDFLQRPLRWLAAISRYRGTVSGGPNFAYDLCARKIRPAERAALDLSSWEVAFDGAEPVRAETLERFAAAFGACGFRRQALFPCYGLAEATLFVSGGPARRPPLTLDLDAAALERHRAVPVAPGDGNGRRLVGCGRIAGEEGPEARALAMEVAIVEPESRRPAGAGEIGEVWVSGPSVAEGYWNRPELTASTFGAVLADAAEAGGGGGGPYLRTGDLGFLEDGELFITGRAKDLIIVRGRNHYPQDLELTVEGSHPALRPSSGAAFSIEVSDPAGGQAGGQTGGQAGSEERLVVVHELRRESRGVEPAEVIAAIRRAVAERHEVQVHAVALIRTASLLKTSSGKVRRSACRASYLTGELAIVARWEADAEPAPDVEAASEATGGLAGAAAPASEEAVLAWLAAEVAARCGVAVAEVDPAAPLSHHALDSLHAVELAQGLETRLGVPVAMESFFARESLAELVSRAWAARAGLPPAEPEPPVSDAAAAAAANAAADADSAAASSTAPLSRGQRALWLLHQLDPTGGAYNVPSALTIEGELDAAALRRACQALVARHAALRTTFPAPQGEPVQRIEPAAAAAAAVSFAEVDAARWSEPELAARLLAEAERPFDLAAGPLLRVHLFRRSKLEHVLLVVLHHIVTDFWSQRLLLADLDALYPAERAGAPAALPLPRRAYADFARRQDEMLAGAEGRRLRDYWRRRLAGELPPLDLPTDRRRPPVQTSAGAAESIALPAPSLAALQALCRRGEATLFMALLAAFDTLLHRYTGESDLLVGVPSAGRRAGFGDVVGYFVNPLVMRSDLAGDPTFVELLARTREAALGAFAHGDYPFPTLVEELQPERDPSRSPLFQVMLALQKAPELGGQDLTPFALGEPGARLSIGGLPLVSRPLPERFAQFDLTLSAGELTGGLTGELAGGLAATFNYNSDLFDAATVARMAEHWKILVDGIAADPARPISRLPLLSTAERHQLLASWNRTAAHVPAAAVVPDLFAAQARQSPDRPAVIFAERELGYAELAQRVDRLAARLAASGVGPEVLVGVCLERSLELVVATLAVLQAGGAYLPLDPEYPPERLAGMMEDAGARRVLTRAGLLPLAAADVEPIYLAALEALDARDPSADLHADAEAIDGPAAAAPFRCPAVAGNAACVIYTSGSTGRPKGVVLTHRNLVNLIVSFIRSYGPDAADRILPLTSVASASFVGEILPLLCAGGAVVLPDREQILDTARLTELIARRGVSILSTVPALVATLNAQKDALPRLRLVLSGGEALAAADVDRIVEGAAIVNGYGLTETTVCSTWYPMSLADLRAGGTVPIGRPLANHRAYVLDGGLDLLPAGARGRLYIGGDGVARGYLGRAALTAERFVPDPFRRGERMYATGDLARWLPSGDLEYLGRADGQVKVRGFRVELGEIEAALGELPAVAQAAVVAREDRPGERSLAAYVVAPAGQPAPDVALLLAHLRERLPDYMVPASFTILPALPLTPNGKLDVKALPAPEGERPDLAAAYAPPQSELERVIAGIWQEALRLDRVGIHDNFFDLGGHSLLLAQVHARLREALGRELSLVDLFKNPTVQSLAAALAAPAAEPRPAARRAASAPAANIGTEIGIDSAATTVSPAAGAAPRLAIVGMSGRFPGARGVDELWRNLRHGVESIRFFDDAELAAAGVDPELIANPDYVKAKGVLGDVDQFDAALFGLSPREVELMDPQHRVFLECSWEALERAGYHSGAPAGRVGVFAGTSMNTYLITNILPDLELVASADTLAASLGNDKDPLTSRVSYKLNLKGPSITVQSASSTGLVAIHVACQSLQNGDCDMALAGGVSIHLPEVSGYLFQEGGTTSPDGHCRAFDARARGFVSGHGCGVVVLKRLDEALAAGDHIHAVVRGSACNNDGSLKVSYTAPSVDGQVEVYTRAYENAGINPETLGYVECHGTATPMGDPIEIAALTQAFRAFTERRGFCAIGSLKTNIGHLDAAAGACGLIKAVLALEHREIPPSLHFEHPNPQIDFAASPFFVNAALRHWEAGAAPRRAGVTSLGMGGTNAHFVLEEAPPREASGPSRAHQLLLLSARSAAALERATDDLAGFLSPPADAPPAPDAADAPAIYPAADLADLAFTLQVGRRRFAHRRALLCRDREAAAAALGGRDPERLLGAVQEPGDRPVVFLFSGQGAQHPGMGRGLYEGEPTFRSEVDRCAELLRPALGYDLRQLLYPPDEAAEAAAARLRQTAAAQPALFVTEYALARLWMEWGVRPQAMLGHSIGELVAACLAGVMSLADGLTMVAARASLMQRLPGGAMLAVPVAEAALAARLTADFPALSIAAVNRPELTVVAGPAAAVAALRERLAAEGIDGRPLHTSHAFHSAMMEPILPHFVEAVRRLRLSPPRLPYISNVTGTWIRPEQATDPLYWAEHLRRTVRFADGVAELLREPSRVFLEVGPGNSLTTLVRQHPARRPEQAVLPSLPAPRRARPGSGQAGGQAGDPANDRAGEDQAFLLDALARAWLAGVEIDWPGFHAHERRRRVPAPTYPFERQRYWVEPSHASGRPGRPRSRPRSSPLADWFYLPTWERGPALPLAPAAATAVTAVIAGIGGPLLLFADDRGLGQELARALGEAGREVVTVTAGTRFAPAGERAYTLDPRAAAGYDLLLADLAERGRRPASIVHLWSVDGGEPRDLEPTLDLGFHSLVHLAQALGRSRSSGVSGSNGAAPATEPIQPIHLLVVSTGLQRVTGEEPLQPAKATLLGPCRVMSREYPSLVCRSLDLALPESAGELAVSRESWLPSVAGILSELARIERPGSALASAETADGAESGAMAVALRGGYRWTESFRPSPQPAPAAAGDGGPAQAAELLPLRRHGVYLITGGLGALGLAIAGYLARAAAARLVLLGRSPLPDRAGWDGWIATHEAADPVSRRIEAVRGLEALGAEVMLAAADVADAGALAAVRGEILERFGALHGIVHAAGRPGGGLLQLKTRQAAAQVLAPKVRGALALEAVFGDLPLDLFVLFSSLTAVLAQPGQSDYAAANAFLDAFAEERRSRGKAALSIGWDAWREIGMAVDTTVPAELAAWRREELAKGMTSAEGVEVFRRALASAGTTARWVISTGDLAERIERSRAPLATEAIVEAPPAQAGHARPPLANAYVPPRSDGEQRIAAVWQELLGIEPVGVHDNFFDLGGNSLTAIRIISRLKAELGVDVAEVSLFEGPTVAALTKLLLPSIEPQGPAFADSRARGERRLARRGGRAGREPSQRSE